MNLTQLSLFGAALTLSSLSLSAQTVVVQWGELGGDNDIVSANQNLSVTPWYKSAVSPTVGANYYGSAGSDITPEFGGANAAWNTKNIVNNADGDRINFGHNTTDPFASTVIWEASEAFDLNTLSIEILAQGAASAEWRYVIQKGGSTYVSDATSMGAWFAGAGNTLTASSLTWYDFTIQAGVGGTGTVGSVAAIDMTDVTGVGYYSELVDAAGGFQSSQTRYFQATAVPEPSTYALIAGMLALTSVALRRRSA